jgi:hypothetical protein
VDLDSLSRLLVGSNGDSDLIAAWALLDCEPCTDEELEALEAELQFRIVQLQGIQSLARAKREEK